MGMPLYRMQVTLTDGIDAFTDIAAVTTFYLDDLGSQSDPTNLAQDTAALFAGFGQQWASPINRVEAAAYEIPDLLGGKTGPPKGVGSAPHVGNTGGPREVACCLSYYAGQNTPRRRGRMYMGPFVGTSLGVRPDPTLTAAILDLGDGILGLGGLDVSWVQYSPTENTSQGVTDYYVDNAWDTQRSRGLDPTARTERVVGPS